LVAYTTNAGGWRVVTVQERRRCIICTVHDHHDHDGPSATPPADRRALVAAALRTWRLGQNGFDNEYYAAAVRSISGSWRNFLYNAFDPGGFVSVDKPPVALWIQVASVKVFGFHSWSVLLPQVLEGLASVALVYHLVARRFGAAAGLFAGLFMAVTPVSVAVDRSGNTDRCLWHSFYDDRHQSAAEVTRRLTGPHGVGRSDEPRSVSPLALDRDHHDLHPAPLDGEADGIAR
jgi:dolichyl-phosphate-mannose-protein mannosyltransferase